MAGQQNIKQNRVENQRKIRFVHWREKFQNLPYGKF